MALDGFGVTFSPNTWCENEGKPMMFMWMATNDWRLGNLHFQALFYMFIFRHKQLLELEEGELYDNVKLLKSESFGNFKGTQTILSFFGLIQCPLYLFEFLKTNTELNSPNFSRTRLYRTKLSRPGKRVILPADSTLARKVDLFARAKSCHSRMLWLSRLDPGDRADPKVVIWRKVDPTIEKGWPG